MNKSIKYIITISLSIIYLFAPAKQIQAQEISLTISPPITEVLIAPGKEVVQNYILKNEGNSTLVSVSVTPFYPQGTQGFQEFRDDLTSSYQNWFFLIDPNIALGTSFNLPKGQSQTISLKIAPPRDASLKDYYFAVFFTTQQDSETGLDTGYSQAKVGSNLLITVSDDGEPVKNVSIKKFSAPLIIDSFAKLSYSVTLENIGRAYVAPMGKIIVSSKPFGSSSELTLAPVNILVSSERDIPCLSGEEQINCSLEKKFPLGLYRAKLTFSLDEETQIYTSEIVTFAFPFSLILGIIFIFAVYKIIFKYVKQG